MVKDSYIPLLQQAIDNCKNAEDQLEAYLAYCVVSEPKHSELIQRCVETRNMLREVCGSVNRLLDIT